MHRTAETSRRTAGQSTTARLTILNGMAGTEIGASLGAHRDWNLELLDLKSDIFGKWIHHLDREEAQRLRTLIEAAGLEVDTFSTNIGSGPDLGAGELAFHRQASDELDGCLACAAIVHPRRIRLIAPQIPDRATVCDAVQWMRSETPWLRRCFQELIDRIADAGFEVVIENEVGGSCLSTPHEVLDFFAWLDHPHAGFTWDIANLWQMGSFPSLATYRQLRPVIRMLHVKGGRSDVPGGRLQWRSSLQAADWPVLEIVGAALRDRACDVVCLNPPHGQDDPRRPYDWNYAADLEFLRQALPDQIR